MNVLIVSFDKNLVSSLKEVLKEYKVIDVRNGEEAINTVSSFVDVVIYDAVAGSISEEDINNIYYQKFKDAKYVVLVDDIFPIDMNNIVAPNKVKVARDEALEKIKEAIMASPEEFFAGGGELSDLEGAIPLEDAELNLERLFFETETAESPPPAETPVREVLPTAETITTPQSRTKLLVVSFDNALIEKIREALSAELEVIEVKNMREVNEKVKEADIIVFDTIMGMLARKTLMDLSKDELLRRKPYILLIDELFTIDIEDVPLSQKYAFAREAELDKAVQKVKELMKEIPSSAVQEELPEEPTQALPQEEVGVMKLLEDIITARVEESTAESSFAETEAPPPPVEIPPDVEALTHNLARALKDAIMSQLSQENLLKVLSQVIKPEEIKEYIAQRVEEKMEDLLREQVQEALSKIDVVQILREEAYRVLKERLREIIT